MLLRSISRKNGSEDTECYMKDLEALHFNTFHKKNLWSFYFLIFAKVSKQFLILLAISILALCFNLTIRLDHEKIMKIFSEPTPSSHGIMAVEGVRSINKKNNPMDPHHFLG